MSGLDIISFDFETGGLVPGYNEPLSIGAKAYNGITLQPYPAESGGEFYSLMKPIHWDRLEPKAMEVNKIKIEDLKNAPDQKDVWLKFVEWVGKYNKSKSAYKAPIAVGKNIRDFDLDFVDVLNNLHCEKKEKTVLFNRKKSDLEDYMFSWFEGSPKDKCPENYKLDTLLPFFGMTNEGSHNALIDARNAGDLVIRFLKLHRDLQKRGIVKWKP